MNHRGPLSLAECAPGPSWTVESLVCRDERLRLRLADMGFTPGAAVRVIRTAPLGDPLEVEVRGYRICLRREAAHGILVRAVEPERCSRGG